MNPERSLLSGGTASQGASVTHSLITAPIFTGSALLHPSAGIKTFPQRAVYGEVISGLTGLLYTPEENDVLYINSNAPFSALVCGVQGSGKSHSTSVILESCLIPDSRLGTLPAALSALVFHLDSAAGGGAVQPCEAAYLGALNDSRGGSAMAPTVTVLVLPTSLASMHRVYSVLPHVRVEPLHFADEDISSSRLLAIMKMEEGASMPLYMEAVMNLLRSMDAEDKFNYDLFKKQLQSLGFIPSQMMMLNIRLGLLDSCLKGGSVHNRVANYFKEGQLTIVDLSSPFMDSHSACGFFDMVLGLFVECRTVSSGKLVVLDEAHKYLIESMSSSRLTESLLGIVRQQRHLNMRVVISTQEPTVVPERFIDLCSIVIAHRFSSPRWMKHLAQHISTTKQDMDDIFDKIVNLSTGEALLFAPAGVTLNSDDDKVVPLGSRYLVIKSRLRITQDGGHSIMAVANEEFATRVVALPSLAGGEGSGVQYYSTPPLSSSGSDAGHCGSATVTTLNASVSTLTPVSKSTPTAAAGTSHAHSAVSTATRAATSSAMASVLAMRSTSGVATQNTADPAVKPLRAASTGVVFVTAYGKEVPSRFNPLVEVILRDGIPSGKPLRPTSYWSNVKEALLEFGILSADMLPLAVDGDKLGVVTLHEKETSNMFVRLMAGRRVGTSSS